MCVYGVTVYTVLMYNVHCTMYNKLGFIINLVCFRRNNVFWKMGASVFMGRLMYESFQCELRKCITNNIMHSNKRTVINE